jgi:hypothetical protein
MKRRAFLQAALGALAAPWLTERRVGAASARFARRRFLYAAVPGIPERVRAGVLVFDIDQNHQCVRRIATPDVDRVQEPIGFKGICASAATGRLYLSYGNKLCCIDLTTDRILWTRSYPAGCDRMAITPNGRKLFVPAGYWTDAPYWFVIDAQDGEILDRVKFHARAHNTICSRDGRWVYLSSLANPWLTVVDAETHRLVRQIGPFSAPIRPFTVDGMGRRCFVCVNGLLGFEVGDLQTGRVVARVEVQGFTTGKVKYHGCPSHGIGLSPDETEIWVVDAANEHVHVFAATEFPPRQIDSVRLGDQPNWVTFSIDGSYVYPSTGDVVERHSRRILCVLLDEDGNRVQSEKLLEIDFEGKRPVEANDQFGVGKKLS